MADGVHSTTFLNRVVIFRPLFSSRNESAPKRRVTMQVASTSYRSLGDFSDLTPRDLLASTVTFLSFDIVVNFTTDFDLALFASRSGSISSIFRGFLFLGAEISANKTYVKFLLFEDENRLPEIADMPTFVGKVCPNDLFIS